MFAAYSYFRAEGAALAAIETLQEAKDEVDSLGQTLCARFGADSISGWVDSETGRYTVNHFRFGAPGEPPSGWVETDSINKSKGSGAVKFALPAPGSADYFDMINFSGLMERAARKTRLEHVLGSGDMPMRDMKDGARPSGMFVKYSMADDPVGNPTKPSGALRHEGGRVFSMSGGPWKSADPIAHMKLGNDWYIRIPNNQGTERPAFTPPDAVPVAYETMLEIDSREQMARFNRLRSSTFEGYS